MDDNVQIGIGRGEIGLDVLCVSGFVALAMLAAAVVVVVILVRRNRKD